MSPMIEPLLTPMFMTELAFVGIGLILIFSFFCYSYYMFVTGERKKLEKALENAPQNKRKKRFLRL